MIKVRKFDIEKHIDKLNQLADNTPNAIENYLTLAVSLCDRVTKKATPVQTGNLRNSFRIGDIKMTGRSGSVDYFNIAEYGTYVEYGHRTRGGKGFVEGSFMLKKGVDAVKQKNETLLKKAWGNVV